MTADRSQLNRLADHIPALRRYARVLSRDGRDAEDLVQDALLRAVDRLRAPGDVINMKSWLFTILHNVFVSRLRKAQVRRLVVSLDDEDTVQPAAAPSQEDALRWRDLLRGFDALPDDQRQVLLLVAVEGLAYAEVAAILAIPIGTVMSRLSRGREKLRQLMDGDGQPERRPDTRPELRRVK
ncbi:MAG TPA: sigma-70 family RNA polymerase sigma factor [Terriglobales bacterium]|nr:sigma-70 family RNA polymerase sigma factor [Terriglobales bacterium]